MNEFLELSQRLDRLIKESGMSQHELARITGIPQSAIQRYASGDTAKIPIDRLEKLAKALGTSAANLLGWIEPSDAEFIQNLGYIHPLEELPEDIAALNAFLYCIGERIIKTNGRYFLGEIGELSDGDLKRLTTAATTSIKVTYDMILNEKRAELMSRFSNQPKKKEK